MEALLLWVRLLLLSLHAPHQLLRVLVLRGHDVGDAQVREHNRGDRRDGVGGTLDHRLIVAYRLSELRLLQKEDMGHVELPELVLGAKLGALPEELLDHRVVLAVPVNLGLRHQDGHVPLKRLIVRLERSLDGLIVLLQPRVLNRLCQRPQRVDVPLGKVVKLSVGLLRRRLHAERGVQELVQLRREELVGEVRILSEDVGGEVVVVVLCVEQQQVGESLGRERRIGEQEVELSEPRLRLQLHSHQRRVVERDWVELLVRSRRHVGERLHSCLKVPHRIFDRRLEIERLHQRRLLQDGRVPDRPDVDPLGLRADRQLGVLADPLLDDLCDVLERWPVLTLVVVAQRDRVRCLRAEARRIHRLHKVKPRLLELLGLRRTAIDPHRLLVQDAGLVDNRGRLVGRTLLHQRFGLEELVLVVADCCLQHQHATLEL
mmetsp:Transcript_35995/g.119196  ORF Transcript_35995/g.119196 Transcript_35995/m.119196 type:complete len:432 (-) Transcript_35995:451-1746(-)